MPTYLEDEIIRIAAKAGAEAAIQKEAEKKKELEKKKHSKRLRNTKLLLEHYREFKAYSANVVYNAETSPHAIDILEALWIKDDDRRELVIDSIKRSAVRTMVIVSHIDTMLDVYNSLVEKSNDELEKRRCRVITARYISDEQLTIEEIAREESIEPRTVYLDIEAAVSKLSTLFFGIDMFLNV